MTYRKGWSREAYRHAMASRGIRTQSEIDAEMKALEDQQQSLQTKRNALMKEKLAYANIDVIDDEFHNAIEMRMFEKIENIPPTEDEMEYLLNEIEIEEYIDAAYGGDAKYFLNDWPIIMENFAKDFSIDQLSRDEIENITEELNLEDDLKEMTKQERLEEIESQVQNLSTDEFSEICFTYIYSYGEVKRFIHENSDWITEMVRAHLHKQRDWIDKDAALELMGNKELRSLSDERFKVLPEEKTKIWNDVLKRYNITQEQYEHIKSLKER